MIFDWTFTSRGISILRFNVRLDNFLTFWIKMKHINGNEGCLGFWCALSCLNEWFQCYVHPLLSLTDGYKSIPSVVMFTYSLTFGLWVLVAMMSTSNSSSTFQDSGLDSGSLGWQPHIRIEDWVVIVWDSTLENEEVATTMVEGMILPHDREHLERLTNKEVVAFSLL